MLAPISYSLAKADPDALTNALLASFIETGFAVLEDHGLPQAVIDASYANAKAFFDLPQETKQKYFDPNGGGQRGYTPFGTENAKGEASHDLKEFWHTGQILPEDHPHCKTMMPTPSVNEVAEFNSATRNLFSSLEKLGFDLLRHIATGLELEEDWFLPKVQHGNSILRLLHYPAQTSPPPEGTVRAAAHEDINVITLLLGADEAGLQVKPKGAKDWLHVHVPEGSLVINVGDMLQRLTNNKLQSTTHRVVNPAPERARYSRYSMPFFLHFEPDVLIETLPGCITSSEPNHYPEPITANAYLHERLVEIGLIKTS